MRMLSYLEVGIDVSGDGANVAASKGLERQLQPLNILAGHHWARISWPLGVSSTKWCVCPSR